MENTSGPAIEVRHRPADSRFEATLEGATAVAEYVRAGGTVTMTHTFSPPELRGRGVAEKLVRAALDWAKVEGLRVVPACSYVAKFVERNPDYRALTQ